MTSQLWEVVGGGKSGGIMVREGKKTDSAELPERLSIGALVKQLKLSGDRLQYELVEGSGPENGWVSIALKTQVLLTKTDKQPGPDLWSSSKPANTVQPVSPPMFPQEDCSPFVFYHRINPVDTKRTGVRMSTIFNAMESCRADCTGDCSAGAVRGLSEPLTDIMLELKPAILKITGKDGMIANHPLSTGPCLSWLRIEEELGFPGFPRFSEQHNVFFIGKVREADKKVPVATGRFFKLFYDDSTGTTMDITKWEAEVEKYFAPLKSAHSSENWNASFLNKSVEPAGVPFTPTVIKQVSWLMSYAYGELYERFYHARIPELLWDLNMRAGGPFADLVKPEPDPQALAASFPKAMAVGATYDALCFLDEGTKKAYYILLPEGNREAMAAVLVVFANYNWADAPEDGKTLRREDLDMCSMKSPAILKYMFREEAKDAPSNKTFDFTKLLKED